MRKQIFSDRTIEKQTKFAKSLGYKPTFQTQIVCDKCKNENIEAFPFGHKEYPHLCNPCYDSIWGIQRRP